MPQLELATYASQIFWLILCFGLLYFYMLKGPLPVLREVLNNRQQRISSDLKKAEALKAEAEAAQEDFTSVISKARQDASVLLHEALTKAAAEEAARSAKIEQNFQHQYKESEHRMLELRKKMLQEAATVAADAAVLIVEKLTGQKIDPAYAKNIAEKC